MCKMFRMPPSTRRDVLIGLPVALLAACAREADWCDAPLYTDDGPFPDAETCQATAADVEGPYYLPDAPERSDLDLYGDAGTPLEISGRVYDAGCAAPLAGAVLELWHADPDGDYDNTSEELRYRCRITTDAEGRYTLRTLLPGRYLNGSAYRPRHIHLKVTDPDGSARLTTQLYFEGDPYIACDLFANSSLVMPFSGDEETAITAADIDIVLS